MVIELLLIACIPLTLFIGCFFNMKAFEKGLNYKKQLEINNLETKNVVIKEKIELKSDDLKENKESLELTNEIINEWLNGKKEV